MYSYASPHLNSVAVSTEDTGAKLGVIRKRMVSSCLWKTPSVSPLHHRSRARCDNSFLQGEKRGREEPADGVKRNLRSST